MSRRRPAAGMITREQEQHLRELFREVVMIRARAGVFITKGNSPSWYGLCEWCKRPQWLQVSHIEPVGRARHLRFDPENARALCRRCHLFTWHKHPRKAEEWITGLMGYSARKALAARADAGGFVPEYTRTKFHLVATRIRLLRSVAYRPLVTTNGREA